MAPQIHNTCEGLIASDALHFPSSMKGPKICLPRCPSRIQFDLEDQRYYYDPEQLSDHMESYTLYGHLFLISPWVMLGFRGGHVWFLFL